MNPADIIALLDLRPLPEEGGYFVETYRSTLVLPRAVVGERHEAGRSAATAIYYLLTESAWSALHRLRSDEIFHHYLGDPVEMLLLYRDGRAERRVLGKDLADGQRPQIVVPAGVWQGSKLMSGGKWALVGTTMSPGFEFADFELADTEVLVKQYPAEKERIEALEK